MRSSHRSNWNCTPWLTRDLTICLLMSAKGEFPTPPLLWKWTIPRRRIAHDTTRIRSKKGFLIKTKKNKTIRRVKLNETISKRPFQKCNVTHQSFIVSSGHETRRLYKSNSYHFVKIRKHQIRKNGIFFIAVFCVFFSTRISSHVYYF